MNVGTIGLPERSAWSAGYAAEYAKGVALYRRNLWRMVFLEGPIPPGVSITFPVFRFPRPVHVIRMHAIVLSADPAQQAALEFGISDVSDRPRDQAGSGQFVTDGRFNRTSPMLAMTGIQFDWFLLDRWQPHNSQWIWTLTNNSPFEETISPVFMLEVEPATEREIAAVAT
jgi:hypothetical protein